MSETIDTAALRAAIDEVGNPLIPVRTALALCDEVDRLRVVEDNARHASTSANRWMESADEARTALDSARALLDISTQVTIKQRDMLDRVRTLCRDAHWIYYEEPGGPDVDVFAETVLRAIDGPESPRAD